jgi:hypothetical protein
LQFFSLLKWNHASDHCGLNKAGIWILRVPRDSVHIGVWNEQKNFFASMLRFLLKGKRYSRRSTLKEGVFAKWGSHYSKQLSIVYWCWKKLIEQVRFSATKRFFMYMRGPRAGPSAAQSRETHERRLRFEKYPRTEALMSPSRCFTITRVAKTLLDTNMSFLE